MTTTSFLERGQFSWLLGIEDTCVYPVDPSRPSLDEHQLTDHHLKWRDDLRDVVALGGTAIRYGMSWPLVHVAPGQFDWTHLDDVVAFAVDDLGLDIVADLVHYGTPTWLPDSFADEGYPIAIEEFASALAARYCGRIRGYTPLNEPVTTASFAGLRAVWPPYRHGWDGWTSVVVPITVGMARATHAIRNADPDAVIVHVDAATAITTREPGAADEAKLLERIGWLPTDLLTGRVDSDHKMWTWLLEHGATRSQLDWLLHHPAAPDVIGVNYYPDLTPRRLTTVKGRTLQVAYNGGADGFAATLRGFAARYGLPLAVTETSIEGDDDTRIAWLLDAINTVNQLATELDLRAFTWWPLFDFVDWSWAAGGTNVEEFAVELQNTDGTTTVGFAQPLGHPRDGKTPFLRRMGLIHLEERADGSLDRIPTAAAHAFARLTDPGDG
ncbi:glycosyl hydrolase family protein [Cryobacterium sp. TMT2-17-1]|uniref:family 1 glycosylhydrolase n=1 Tax=unclassified Cryobacterium TaxID=2649013 RepID=UPI00106ABB76|nr:MULTISPECIES: family 1 glycosylhydrolase [unclassified Cryobacterium]TFC49772.1 glycosyl hydrolase family protein [Cryobacterium sp. TMT2-17-1]TFC65123.1 glycosyl hydrolase family protein [Cryobacterium sp. TMT2-4]